MKFLLEDSSKTNTLDMENLIVKKLLKDNKYLHEYKEISIESLNSVATKSDVPIGTIGFVTKWLNLTHNIERENPIEIPKYLRTDEFLKREYKIVNWQDLPENGRYFIKDVSELKSFGQEVNLSYENIKEWFEKPQSEFNHSLVLNREHLFQVSSIYDIQSEYRVYVIDNEIVNISNYNGDCTLFPSIELLKKAIGKIATHEKYLKSYTIDVMVGKEGTAIIEIHNFTSVGLYHNLWGNDLLYAYRDGIDYLINDNKEIES